jgi:thiamine kinase-like enzyme
MKITNKLLIQLIPDWSEKKIDIQPISSGITNLNFKVIVDNTPYFLSIADTKSQILEVSFNNKYYNNNICAELELSPKVLYFFQSKNIIITEFIDSKHLSNGDFGIFENINKLINIIKSIHQIDSFHQEFNMFSLLKNYMSVIKNKNIKITKSVYQNLKSINEIGAKLEIFREELVPCHNDLVSENILIKNEKLYIIDFDYSGNNDPCFEIGNLCVEMDFNEKQVNQIIEKYFGELNNHLISRVNLHAILSDFGWSLWSFIQSTISNVDFDFKQYGNHRLNRAISKIHSSNYDYWMKGL